MPSLSHIDGGSRLGMRPSSTEPFQYSPSSVHQIHRRQQSLPLLRQASLTSSLATKAAPLNAAEWKHTIDEVKQKYLARKYRSCSMQCCEVLGNLKDTSTIEPLHLIYLHFYAASSFEWCARPLSSSSTYRAELLRSAQKHYAEAEVLIAAMEWNVAERARPPSWVTSPSSPSLSASSRVPDLSSTASSSPRTSAFSLDDEPPARPARKARVKSSKKKVSFSSLPQFFEFQPEPYIRPDSPTLGWEDPFFMSPPHEMDAPFTMSPKKHGSPTSIIKPPLEGSTPSNHTFDLESFLQTRTLNRFRGQLSALRDQVCRHRAVVDGLLATPDETPTPRPPSRLDARDTSSPVYAHRPMTPMSARPSSPALSAAGGRDEKNLQDRIERLRASGWRRKRFDSRRYEALREQVLGELEP
ncbi:hypothetical protein F5Y12DRAFT_781580 [Xylaria sp. FL1777]|nr:hypothetical protein F5Y12DRAFT_781580 [Xylaria sp. FL1777]